MRNRHLLAAVAALAVPSTTAPARADSYIITDTTINTADSGNVIVGYADQTDFFNRTNPYDAAVNLVAGGSVGQLLDIYNNSTLNMSGGSIGIALNAADNTSVTIANITGGSGTELSYDNSAIVNLYGGSFGSFDANGGTLNIYGTGLSADLMSGRPTYYVLHGTLEDGTSIEGDELEVDGSTTLNLFEVPAAVPEPSSLVMCGLAGLIGSACA